MDAIERIFSDNKKIRPKIFVHDADDSEDENKSADGEMKPRSRTYETQDRPTVEVSYKHYSINKKHEESEKILA